MTTAVRGDTPLRQPTAQGFGGRPRPGGRSLSIRAMLVAHALWSPGRGFCVWAENSSLVGRIRRDDEDEVFGLRRHSFAVGADMLGAVLGLGAETAGRAGPV